MEGICKQQTANSKQQTANSKQQTANSKQQTASFSYYKLLLLTLISGLVLNNACTTIEFPADGAKAQAESIENGTISWDNPRNAVMIFNATADPTKVIFTCSGVLIDNSHVLTARHCNVTAAAEVHLPRYGGEEIRHVATGSPHPDGVDAYFITLDQAFPVDYVTKLYPGPTDTFAAGQGLSFTCYGAGPNAANGSGYGVMRYATLPLEKNVVSYGADPETLVKDRQTGAVLNPGLRWLRLGPLSSPRERALEGDSGGPCFYGDQLVGLMFGADIGFTTNHTAVEPVELFRDLVDFGMFSWAEPIVGIGGPIEFIDGPAAVSTALGHVDIFATGRDPTTTKLFVYHRSEQDLNVVKDWYKTPLETPYPPAVVPSGTSSSVSAATVYITKADHTVARRVWENNSWQQEETIPTIRCEGGPAVTFNGAAPQVYCAASVGTGKLKVLRGGFFGSGSIGHAANGIYDERYPVDTNGELTALLAPGAIRNVPMLFARTYASSEVYVTERFMRFSPPATFWNKTSMGLGSAAPGVTFWDSSRMDAFVVFGNKLWHQERINGQWARTSTDFARTNISLLFPSGVAEVIGKPAAVSTGFGKMSIFVVSASDKQMLRFYYPYY